MRLLNLAAKIGKSANIIIQIGQRRRPGLCLLTLGGFGIKYRKHIGE